MTSGHAMLQTSAISEFEERHGAVAAEASRKTRRGTGVSGLFDCWDEVVHRIRAAKKIGLFLDFDGTMVEFCPRPDQVRLSDEARAALRRVTAHPSIQVAVVSGRRRASLEQFVKIPGVRLQGLYGWEGEEGLDIPKTTMRRLSKAREMLAGLPSVAPGIYIEDKEIGLAVHFRDASAQVQKRASVWLRRSLAPLRTHLRIIRGSNVWEIVPRQVRGKGVAVRQMLGRLQMPFLPIYVGDDLTDEPAFKALRDGITVLVGPQRPTNARFRLRNAEEVCMFLERLEAELP